jgi:nucleoid-associated protein YgaU
VSSYEHVFVRVLFISAFVLVLWALFARESGAVGPEQHYRVRAGDTLWSIAVAHYAGDPREGVWELRQHNHLAGTMIQPGQRLSLP